MSQRMSIMGIISHPSRKPVNRRIRINPLYIIRIHNCVTETRTTVSQSFVHVEKYSVQVKTVQVTVHVLQSDT